MSLANPRVHRPDVATWPELPDYPFQGHYVEVDDERLGRLRMHHLDEGDPADPCVLLLHGEPTWSYLYRHMIPPLVESGYRVLVPDLIGFGKSDKPTQLDDYSFAGHLRWLKAWFEQTAPDRLSLFCQDWGGLLGLCLLADSPNRFQCCVAANTSLPTGTEELPEEFRHWVDFVASAQSLPVGRIIQNGCVRRLSQAELGAYDTPFADADSQAGARAFPMLVPMSEDSPGAVLTRNAWRALSTFHKPFSTAFSDRDPITAAFDEVFQQRIPGAKLAPHITIRNAGHFLQEDAPADLAVQIVRVVRESS